MLRFAVLSSLALVVGCYVVTPISGHEDEDPGGTPARPDGRAGEESAPPAINDGGQEPDAEPKPCEDGSECGRLELEVDWECEPGTVWDSEPSFAGSCDPLLVMIGIYEATSEHSFGYHPRGTASVRVTPTWRPLVLALSAYEPVEWAIEREPGAEIEQILVYGYYDQVVSGAEGVPVVDRSGERFGAYADYSWPTGDGGDEPQVVAADAESLTGLELSAFRGCYHAEEMTVSLACESECTPACDGRECGSDGCGGSCGSCPSGRGCSHGRCVDLSTCAWVAADFVEPLDVASCEGDHFMRYDDRYGLWVGIVQCSHGLRFYLSESELGPFYPATDLAGHGQDFCELVDPLFTLPNEDDITSGGCSACSTGRNYPLEGVPAWGRGYLGEPFEFTPRTGTWSWQTSVVDCAVDISEPPGSRLFCE